MNDRFFTDEENGLSACAASVKSAFLQKEKAIRAWDKANGGKLDADMTREDYVSLLSALEIRKKSSFTQYRMALARYVRYQIACGNFSDGQEKILMSVGMGDMNIAGSTREKVVYFRNLAHLRSCMEETVRTDEPIDDAKFELHVCASYLAWFGLTIEQICTVKKADVLEDGVMVDGKLVKMPIFVMDQLLDYKESRGFSQQARGVIFHTYQASEYLFRTERSSQITVSQMYQLFKRFNAVMDRQYSITYDVIHMSGIFNRAYAEEVESIKFDIGDKAFAERVFETAFKNDEAYRNMISDYTHYKKLFQ